MGWGRREGAIRLCIYALEELHYDISGGVWAPKMGTEMDILAGTLD